MKPTEISKQVMEAIIRLKEQNKSIKIKIGNTEIVVKSTIWYFLKKKRCTGGLNNIIRLGRTWKVT